MTPVRFRKCLAIALLLMLLPTGAAATPLSGQPAPAFKAITINGQAVQLDSYSNQLLVLDFFASWCIPCRKSVPHLVEMNRKYSRQGLQVLGLSVDDGENTLRAFVDKHKINYPVALASEAAQQAYGIRELPVTVIIDSKGRIKAVYRGYSDETGRAAERIIKALLVQ